VNFLILTKKILKKYFSLLYHQIQDDLITYKRKKEGTLNNPKNFSDIANQKSVFILSTGRCGTKWLTELLKYSKKISVEHDPVPKIYFQSQYVYKNKFDKKAVFSSFLHARYDYLYHAYCVDKPYVETNNRITFYAESIADKLPETRFVHIIRHPYEVIRSGMRRNWYKELNSELSGHISPELGEQAYNDWPDYSREQKIAWLWKQTNEIIEKLKIKLDSDRFLTIKSSEMFNNELSLIELLEFIGADDIIYANLALKKTQMVIVNKQESGIYPEISDWDNKTRLDIKLILNCTELYGFEL